MLSTMVNINYVEVAISTNSAQDTIELGLSFGKNLKGGEIIQLISDLGGGKTTLIKGIVKGIGSDDIVASPTFTVQKDYNAGNLEIHHFDFYRLSESGVVGQELKEYIENSKDIILIEWGEIVSNVLPEDTVFINIKPSGDDKRIIKIQIPKSKKYILQGIE